MIPCGFCDETSSEVSVGYRSDPSQGAPPPSRGGCPRGMMGNRYQRPVLGPDSRGIPDVSSPSPGGNSTLLQQSRGRPAVVCRETGGVLGQLLAGMETDRTAVGPAQPALAVRGTRMSAAEGGGRLVLKGKRSGGRSTDRTPRHPVGGCGRGRRTASTPVRRPISWQAARSDRPRGRPEDTYCRSPGVQRMRTSPYSPMSVGGLPVTAALAMANSWTSLLDFTSQ